MRLPTERQAFAFLEPLRGKSVVIAARDRATNLNACRFLLSCLAVSRTNVSILDTGVCLGTNIAYLAEKLSGGFLQGSNIMTPYGDSGPETMLSELVTAETPAFLIDDLNSLLYLLSSSGHRSGVRRISAFFHLLSYSARMNGSFVVGTVYKRDDSPQTVRSLAGISDLQVNAELEAEELSFTSQGTGWPDERFGVPLYLEPRT